MADGLDSWTSKNLVKNGPFLEPSKKNRVFYVFDFSTFVCF